MVYFVSGGTGSFGQHFIPELLKWGHKPVVYSRDELKQYEMAKKYPQASYIVGDIRDADRLKRAMLATLPDYVVHAAALKHVATGEDHPLEAVKTNVLGTQNVIDACIDCGVKRATILSTDKACAPVNFYGATKMIAERLWINANRRHPAFTAVRYGNVIGSSGSVLHVFNTQKDHGIFRVTDKRMTRFAVTFDYAVDLVMRALKADPGATLVSKVPAFRVIDLAASFDPDAPCEEIGIQPGEKLHESLLTEYERARALDFGTHWQLPPDTGEKLPDKTQGYSSDQGPFMTVRELEELVSASL